MSNFKICFWLMFFSQKCFCDISISFLQFYAICCGLDSFERLKQKGTKNFLQKKFKKAHKKLLDLFYIYRILCLQDKVAKKFYCKICFFFSSLFIVRTKKKVSIRQMIRNKLREKMKSVFWGDLLSRSRSKWPSPDPHYTYSLMGTCQNNYIMRMWRKWIRQESGEN